MRISDINITLCLKASVFNKIRKAMRIRKHIRMLSVLLAGIIFSACTDWIYDDRSGCEHGVWLSFKYDYNLQRIDMIEHVGSVGVFVYDEQGHYITSFIEPDMRRSNPYRMYIDLPEGRYYFVALAEQNSFEQVQAGPGANFIWETPSQNETMEDLAVTLEYTLTGEQEAIVDNEQSPLDTLWHAVSAKPLYVPSDRYAYDTLSLVRDTKSISISLREIDHPETMDIADYEFNITHRNLIMTFNSETADAEPADNSPTALYTPYATWNTSDDEISGTSRSGSGRTAHADFMTSRLYAYDNAEQNARLTIRHRESDRTVIEADLCNLLGQLRTYDETRRYTLQEFLDRGYDFRLTFFLKGGEWQYTDVSIGVLGWSKRIQNVSLGI